MPIEEYLPLFVRDDLVAWQTASKKPPFTENQLRDHVYQNVDLICKRVQSNACKAERQQNVRLTVYLFNSTSEIIV